jgi:hypothetical protein
VLRVFDSAGPRGKRAIAPRVVAFRTAGRRPLPGSQISELNTQPHMPLSNASSAASRPPSHGSGGQVGSLFLTCVISSITARSRFIPTPSLHSCSPTLRGLYHDAPP